MSNSLRESTRSLIDAAGSAAEVAACPVDDGPLWPFRMGRRPRYSQGIDSGAVEGHPRGTLAASGGALV